MEEMILHDNHEMEQTYCMYKLKCTLTKQNYILGNS